MKKTILIGLILLCAVNVTALDLYEYLTLHEEGNIDFKSYREPGVESLDGYINHGSNGIGIRAYGQLGLTFNELRILPINTTYELPGVAYFDEQGKMSIIPIQKLCKCERVVLYNGIR